jgi:hypothetical protein
MLGPAADEKMLPFTSKHPDPCWDLLFTMAEQRRNSSDVQSIATIGLPASPVVPILRLLVDTLGGKKAGEEGDTDGTKKTTNRIERMTYKDESLDSLIHKRLETM